MNAEAIKVYSDLKAVGLKPDEVTIMMALRVAGNLKTSDFFRTVANDLTESNVKLNTLLATSMLNAMNRLGMVDEVSQFFDVMLEKGLADNHAFSVVINCVRYNRAPDLVDKVANAVTDSIAYDRQLFLSLAHSLRELKSPLLEKLRPVLGPRISEDFDASYELVGALVLWKDVPAFIFAFISLQDYV
jgi:pentatricopeptide repeat protein